MPIEFKVLASVYRGLVEIIEEAGHQRPEFHRRFGLDLNSLDTPQETLPIEQITALWQLGYEVMGPTIGIEASRRVRLRDFQEIGVFLTATENIADWMTQVDHYSSLFSNISEVKARPTESGMEVTTFYHAEVPLKDERIEFITLVGPMLASQYLDSPLKLKSAELPRPKPLDTQPWDDAFGVKVKWAAPFSRYVIDYREAKRLIITRNPQIKKGFQVLLNSKLKGKRKTDPLADIRNAIVKHLPEGDANLAAIAADMNVSERSLQRKLKNADTTFTRLLTEVRTEMAQEYLQRSIPESEITYLLGYKDVAVFRRAFLQWTGKSPSAFARNTEEDSGDSED